MVEQFPGGLVHVQDERRWSGVEYLLHGFEEMQTLRVIDDGAAPRVWFTERKSPPFHESLTPVIRGSEHDLFPPCCFRELLVRIIIGGVELVKFLQEVLIVA
jgi:hypothetical protein